MSPHRIRAFLCANVLCVHKAVRSKVTQILRGEGNPRLDTSSSSYRIRIAHYSQRGSDWQLIRAWVFPPWITGNLGVIHRKSKELGASVSKVAEISRLHQ